MQRRYAPLIDSFGEQATYGAPVWFGRVGNRFGGITLLGAGEGGGVLKAYYATGREIPEFASPGVRNWKYHTSDPGVLSGPPELIPGLTGYRPDGQSWVEWLAPAELTEGADEPEPILWIIWGLKVHDYTFGGGLLVQGAKIKSANNSLVALFIATHRQGMPLTRFHKWGQSWIDFKDRCSGAIAFAAGTGLLGQYYSDATLTTLVHTRNEPYIDRDWDYVSPAPDVPAAPFSARFTGKVKPAHTGTWTFYARYDDGCRLWVNGVQLVNDWAAGAMRESSGATSLTANVEYDIVVEYFQQETLGGLHLSWSHASVPKEIVPQSRLIPPSRNIERYNAHLAFPPGTPAPAAFAAVFRRAPGVNWQDVNGAIRVLTTPDRAATHPLTYDLTQTVKRPNILDGSFSLTPMAREGRPDYLVVPYDDLEDPFFTPRTAFADRREDPTKPPKNPLTLPHVGVATHSLASRIAETEMNVLHALPYFVNLSSFADSHKIAKCDVVPYSHEVTGVRESSPFKLFITKETFLSGGRTADDRAFVGRSHAADWYADDAHAVLPQRIVSDIPSPFVPPPPVSSVTLLKFDRFTPDDTHVPFIQGAVQFAPFAHPQRARVYWKRPRKGFAFDPVTDFFTVALHGFPAGARVELFSTVTLPAGFSAGTVYYVINPTQNTFQLSLTPGGAAVTSADNGEGTREVREFDFAATNIIVTPDPTTLQGSFEVENVPLGINDFKVVTESLKGVTRGAASATTYTFNVVPLSNPANVTGFVVDDVSRAGIRLKWNANAEDDVRQYEIDRSDNGGADWYFVARTDSTTWTDRKYPSGGGAGGGALYRIRALARGRRYSTGYATAGFDDQRYGTVPAYPTLTLAQLTAAEAVLTVTPGSGMTEQGKNSVVETVIEVKKHLGGISYLDLFEKRQDGLTQTISIPASVVMGSSLRVFAHYNFIFSGGEYSGPDSAALDITPQLISSAELPSGSTSAKGAVQTTTATSTVVSTDDTRMTNARTPTAHAASHKHGGSDEVAVSTPAANAIPKAGSGGTLDAGWMPDAGAAQAGKVSTGTQTFAGAKKFAASVVVGDSPANYELVIAGEDVGVQIVTPSTGNGASDGFRFGIDSLNRPFFWNQESSDLYFGTSATERVRILAAGQLKLSDVAAPASSPADSVQLWSESVGGSSELRVRDEAGNVTTLSPHAQDAPAWMYDPDDRQPPRLSREVNQFAGRVRWTNHTRRDRLQQMLFDGKNTAALPAERRQFVAQETFAEYNARVGLAEGDPGHLKAEDWDKGQQMAAEERERDRAAWRARRDRAAARGLTVAEPEPVPYRTKARPAWLGDAIVSDAAE